MTVEQLHKKLQDLLVKGYANSMILDQKDNIVDDIIIQKADSGFVAEIRVRNRGEQKRSEADKTISSVPPPPIHKPYQGVPNPLPGSHQVRGTQLAENPDRPTTQS